jgi:Sigma-70, region 4
MAVPSAPPPYSEEMADDLHRFCIRMLGDGPAARTAAEAAGAAGGGDRLAGLRAAVAECRQGAEPAAMPVVADEAGTGLAAAVARELATACARLTSSQREALALRELIGLSYEEVADVTEIAPGDVAPLLADARLRLRDELRGDSAAAPDCPERERALRTIAARQDAEPVAAADEDWRIAHLGICRGCAQAHAAMLEATARYRAWGAAEGAAAPAGA